MFLQNIFNLCKEKYRIIFFVTWAEQIKGGGDAGMPEIEENDVSFCGRRCFVNRCCHGLCHSSNSTWPISPSSFLLLPAEIP